MAVSSLSAFSPWAAYGREFHGVSCARSQMEEQDQMAGGGCPVLDLSCAGTVLCCRRALNLSDKFCGRGPFSSVTIDGLPPVRRCPARWAATRQTYITTRAVQMQSRCRGLESDEFQRSSGEFGQMPIDLGMLVQCQLQFETDHWRPTILTADGNRADHSRQMN